MSTKNKKVLGFILLAGLILATFTYIHQKSVQVSSNPDVVISNTYTPPSDIVTVISPADGNLGSLKIHFPRTMQTNKEVVDCYSGNILRPGSKVLLSGGDGFSGYGWGYTIGVSQTQINPQVDTNFSQDQYGVCPIDYSASLITLKIVKDYDYAEMQKIGFEDENTKFIGEEKIKVGNIETQARVYTWVWNQPKGFNGKPAVIHTYTVYHFNVGDDYFIIQKPIYDGTIETAFDDKVLNEVIDYIWNHLEFEQK